MEPFGGHGGLHFWHQGFAFVEREEGYLELYGEGVVEKPPGAGEHLRFVALNVELEEDVAAGGCEGVCEMVGKEVIEAAEGNLLLLEIGGVGGRGEMGVEHGED